MGAGASPTHPINSDLSKQTSPAGAEAPTAIKPFPSLQLATHPLLNVDATLASPMGDGAKQAEAFATIRKMEADHIAAVAAAKKAKLDDVEEEGSVEAPLAEHSAAGRGAGGRGAKGRGARGRGKAKGRGASKGRGRGAAVAPCASAKSPGAGAPAAKTTAAAKKSTPIGACGHSAIKAKAPAPGKPLNHRGGKISHSESKGGWRVWPIADAVAKEKLVPFGDDRAASFKSALALLESLVKK